MGIFVLAHSKSGRNGSTTTVLISYGNAMNKSNALGTMTREDKGPVALPPSLSGMLGVVAAAVSTWRGVKTTTHWHFSDRSRVDGVDFYVGQEELGHLHLDGSVHLATNPILGEAMVAAGQAQRFPYQRGWVCADVEAIGAAAAIALFERNYAEIVRSTAIA